MKSPLCFLVCDALERSDDDEKVEVGDEIGTVVRLER